ncbi:MAG: hypothetical protein Q4B72_04565 [Lachnospiraceae bacterium]|nr:hypothetical protein [Lachnospiraceae bacterium]
MKFPFLASVILFCLILRILLKRGNKTQEQELSSFWDRERQANATRRKSLDDLDYITLPLESFPMQLLTDEEEITDCIRTIQSLSEKKIVNFTGYTNTDLKLMYGAPNITQLIQYDQSYTALARTLQKWAALLYDRGYVAEARVLLEFAVSTHTDVSGTYSLLCQIYRELNEPEKIPELLVTANTLRSARKDTIVRIVQESCP